MRFPSKIFRIFLLVLIVAGLGSVMIQTLWAPKVANTTLPLGRASNTTDISGKTYTNFQDALVDLKKATSLPVPFPVALPKGVIYNNQLHVSFTASKDEYYIDLSSMSDCEHTNSCFAGYIEVNKNPLLATQTKINLTNSTSAYYKPLTCGGSCSPPSIEWFQNGIHYAMQLNVEGKGQALIDYARLTAQNVSIGKPTISSQQIETTSH